MKEIMRTCRAIHECVRCFRYITFGERYKHRGNGERIHVRCERPKTWRLMPVPGSGIPRIVDLLESIPLAGERLKGSANIFTHTHGVGPNYRLVLNSKGITPSQVGLEVDNHPREMNVGYGCAVNLRLPNFIYRGDAFGFHTPKAAANEAARQFEGVLRLFKKLNEKKVRRRMARTGKLTFFPGVYD